MPQKITKPNNKRTQNSYNQITQNNAFWNDFAKDCIGNQYVLVLGNEAILNLNNSSITDCEGNSSKLLLKLTTADLEEQGLHIENIESWTQLYGHVSFLHRKVCETISSFNFNNAFNEEIEPFLMQLLETKCFRMVLTTTVDPYIEIAMEKVWGKGGFRVKNIYGTNEELDLMVNEQSIGEFNEMKPTLFYVFGKADITKPNNKFVLTDNDAMEVIRKWFSEEGPKQLIKYINEKKILAIGCKYDDWLFRFFWYILRGDINNLSSGQVAVEFNDANLISYLRQQRIRLFDETRNFMKDAVAYIKQTINLGNIPRQLGGIFISYAHEDKYIAIPLFYHLRELGYKVWLDEDITPNNNDYNLRITNAINQCCIFLPILSSQVKYDLEMDNHRYYIETEWNMAQRRYINEKNIGHNAHRMRVLPIIIGDYNVSSDYHQKTPDCILNVTAFELAIHPISVLFNSIDNI